MRKSFALVASAAVIFSVVHGGAGEETGIRSGALPHPIRPGVVGLANADLREPQSVVAGLARRYGEVVLVHQGFSTAEVTGRGERSGMMEFTDGVVAIEELAPLVGSVPSKLAPGVTLLVRGGFHVDFPIVLTAERAGAIGQSRPLAISPEELERLLLVYASPISTTHHSLFSPFWFAAYYWPSREGDGHELYVLTHSTGALHPQGIWSRGLTKYTIESSGGAVTLGYRWGCAIPGPAANLELDFDDDGVIDILCFSGLPGSEWGVGPLVVISGATGERIGELGTYSSIEGVVTESRDSKRRVVVLDRSGFMYYELTDEGRLALVRVDEAPDDKVMLRLNDSLLRGARLPGAATPALVLEAGEKVLADFKLSPAPAAEESLPAVRHLPPLARIGERMVWPGKDSPELQNAHILVEYWPQPEKEPAPPQR